MSLRVDTEHFEESNNDKIMTYAKYIGIILLLLTIFAGGYGVCKITTKKYY